MSEPNAEDMEKALDAGSDLVGLLMGAWDRKPPWDRIELRQELNRIIHKRLAPVIAEARESADREGYKRGVQESGEVLDSIATDLPWGEWQVVYGYADRVYALIPLKPPVEPPVPPAGKGES